MRRTGYDAIVIGGGVVGAACAYHLARADLRTLLLDRRDAGRATDAGAGILAPAHASRDQDPIHRFEAAAASYYPTLIETLRADGAGTTGYRACGSLTVALDDDEARHLDQIRAGARGWRAAKDGHVELSPGEARAMFPPLAEVQGAIHCPGDARVDGRLLSAALRQGGQRHGLEIRDATVDALVVEGGAAAGVRVGEERIVSRHLVIAAGAWSGALLRPLGLALPVAPQRGQIAHLVLPGTDTSAWPIVLAFRGHYLVPWEDSRMVAGATRETGSGFAPHTTAAGVLEVLREALRVAPGLAGAEIREVRVGLRPASRDGRPILGAVPGISGLHLCTGHGATGLQLGPYSGKVVADLITGAAPATSSDPFSPARFDLAAAPAVALPKA